MLALMGKRKTLRATGLTHGVSGSSTCRRTTPGDRRRREGDFTHWLLFQLWGGVGPVPENPKSGAQKTLQEHFSKINGAQ